MLIKTRRLISRGGNMLWKGKLLRKPKCWLVFLKVIIKFLIFYSKTNEDFISAPETFKFEDRDWILKLGWERYDKSAPAKDRQKPKSEMGIIDRVLK